MYKDKNYLKIYSDIINCPLQELTLSQLYKHIKRDGYDVALDHEYNIFVKNNVKKNNILIVAHLDRVLGKEPRLFRYEDEPSHIYGAYGWDDRAGVIAALELYSNNDVDLLFTTGEESGCVGAKQVNPNKISQYNLIFELDRHGSHDFINDCSMGLLCNDDFTNDICYHVGSKGYNLKPATGVFTDIGALRDKNKTAQMFYMSCGYYHEHSTEEYLIMEEFISSIEKAQIIIDYVNENPDVIKPFVEPVKLTPATKNTRSTYDTSYHHTRYDEDWYYCPFCDGTWLDSELIYQKCPNCGHDVEVLEYGADDDIIK